ncbi:MAG: hypothetical protein ACI8T1_001147 [Verrucomicrobiales bacterium]|jgi:hypothetical protein
MIVVAFVVIIAFAVFFSPYDARDGNLNQAIAFRMGNKGITVKEVDRQTRILQSATDLGLSFTSQLLQPTFDVVDFTQNRVILAEQARKLGIDPSEGEVQKALAEHPQFQRDGKFSEDAYLDAITNTLKPNGLVAGDLRELMADKIRLDQVSALLSSSSEVPDTLVDIEFQRERELIKASVVDFKLEDFEKDLEVTDAELQTFYDEQKALIPSQERQAERRLDAEQVAAMDLMMADEKRKVEFVFITAPIAPIAAPPVAPGFAPPPMLTPGPGSLAPPPILIPPAGDESEPPASDESEPPGQAPSLDDAAAALEIEPLPAPPIGDDLDLTPADQLGGDVNVGGLGEDAPVPTLDLGGNLDLGGPELQMAPDFNAPGASAGANDGDYQTQLRAYEEKADKFYTALSDTLKDAPESADGQLKALADADGLEVKTSELFTQEELPASPIIPTEYATTIFKTTLESDNGLVVPVEGLSPKGFYIGRLLEIIESTEYTFDEVKDELRKAVIKKKAGEKMKEAVNAAREKLIAALDSGKSFADAMKEQGLTSRDIPEFSINKRPAGAENVTEILQAVPKTTTGSVSELTEAGDNALLLYVSQRVAASEAPPAAPEQPVVPGAPADPAAEKKSLAGRLKSQASSSAVGLWIADRRTQADIARDIDRMPPRIYFPWSRGGGGFGF